jgi:hypothetical protein
MGAGDGVGRRRCSRHCRQHRAKGFRLRNAPTTDPSLWFGEDELTRYQHTLGIDAVVAPTGVLGSSWLVDDVRAFTCRPPHAWVTLNLKTLNPKP